MDTNSLVLAALSPAGGAEYTPVQVQKLLFLIEMNVPHEVGGQHFDFQPYDYGPFDKTIYQVLETLEATGLIQISEAPGRSWKTYRLTDEGTQAGSAALSQLSEAAQDYIRRLSKYVRTVSFAELVSSVYKAYPEMKVNSVFQD